MKPEGNLEVLVGHAQTRHTIRVTKTGRSLADVLAEAGFPVNTRCGQRGWCQGCQVELLEGEVQLKSGRRQGGPASVRACLSEPVVGGHAVIHLPERARMESGAKVGDSFALDVPYRLDPLFPITDRRDTLCAVDLGTTTVVVLLADGRTGSILSRAGAFNAQTRHGDNVISRIVHGGNEAGRNALQDAVVRETLAPLLLQACKEANRGPERIAGITVAGNTTMLHLLAGKDPTSLGVIPFTPRFLDARDLQAREIGLTYVVPGLPADTVVHLLPGLSAYVGADLTAGMFATGMAFDAEPSLLVDLGTNGEIVLQQNRCFRVCATAAGPAFEGMGLTSGTRAQRGAIERVRLADSSDAWQITRIGGPGPDRSPGLCGSGYVDYLSEGRRLGLLEPSGRYHQAFWSQLPANRRATRDNSRSVLLENRGPGSTVEVTERDIAALLQAKAAIGAGIDILLQVAGLEVGRLSRLYLAGGFGLHLDIGHAMAIGLLPRMDPSAVRVVGNTSLAGALLAALDCSAVPELGRFRGRTEVVALNTHPEFEDRYLDHLQLPG